MNANLQEAVLYFRQLVTGISPQGSGFTRGPLCVRFVADKMSVGQGFVRLPGLLYHLTNFNIDLHLILPLSEGRAGGGRGEREKL